MRRFAFIVAIVGLFVFALLLNFGGKEMKNYEDLEKLEVNQRVSVSGKVIDERVVFGNERVLMLNNGIEMICECDRSYKGSVVEVEGVVEEYKEKRQVRVLKIIVLDFPP